jgi:Leucine rich repeat variant
LLEILAQQSQYITVAADAKFHVKFAGEITAGWEEIARQEIKSLNTYDSYDEVTWHGINSLTNLSELFDLLPDIIINRHDVRQKIASDPHTPSNILEKLADDGYKLIRCIIATNPSTPSQLAEKIAIDLAENGNEWCCENLAKYPNTPTSALQALLNHKSDKVRLYLALNPNTPETTLEDLATDKHHICQAVARNPKAPIYILEQLATYAYWGIRSTVAENPNTPVALLEQLAKDESSEVYLSVLKNPKTPVNLFVQALSESENGGLIRYTIAANPSTPVNILEQLVEELTDIDKSCWGSITHILCEIAANPSTPVNILKQFAAEKNNEILYSLINNPNIPITILQQLASDEDDEMSDIRRMASTKLNNINYLSKELVDKPIYTLKEKKAILNNLASKKNPSLARLAVFLSDYAEESILASNSSSLYWLERYAIAQNINTPIDVLQHLEKDGNRIVRAAAKANKKRLW